MTKGLQALGKITGTQNLTMYEQDECLKIIEKELKALEIIKPLVDLSKGQQHCWLWLGMNGMQITQEEYDLLKEILL